MLWCESPAQGTSHDCVRQLVSPAALPLDSMAPFDMAANGPTYLPNRAGAGSVAVSLRLHLQVPVLLPTGYRGPL